MQSDPKELYKPCSRLSKHMSHSVFEEINALCAKTKAINMAQGYPDWEPPEFVKEAFQRVANNTNENQYTRVGGHPKLVKTLAEEYGPKFNRQIDPMEEITITNGAVGVFNNFLFAFLEENDEVILTQPTYPFYAPMVDLYRGKVRFSTLQAPKNGSEQWTYDFEEIEKLFNENTKAIVLNTPHNPTGKALKKEECERFIEILKKWPKVIVMSDEIYEHVLYDDNEHIRIGSWPGMWDRTISMYSGGKIFSVTGWRIGWGIGPSYLIKPLVAAQTWTTFCINRPAQAAIAEALEKAGCEGSGEGQETFYTTLKDSFQRKKDMLRDALVKGCFDFKVLNPEGGYFLIVDISKCIPKIPLKYFYKDGTCEETKAVEDGPKPENADFTADFAFVRWMMVEYGVATIPLYPFYDQSRDNSEVDKKTSFIRFTICKEDETIKAVGEKLAKK